MKRHFDKVAKGHERRRSAFSATERIGDSTECDQARVDRDQIYSHPYSEFCDGWALAAAVALLSRQILARAPEAAAQYSADPGADR